MRTKEGMAVTLLEKAIAQKSVIEKTRADADELERRIAEKEKALESLRRSADVTARSHDYLDALVKEESVRFVQNLTDILNYGMRTIFDDEEYTISIQTDGSRASIWLDYESGGQHVHTDIRSCGGGIRTVIGFLMQVYFLYQHEAGNIIVVDEGFSQLSAQYMPNLFRLIHELCEKNGLDILLVTHDQRVMEYADRHYEIKDGEAVEV